jgi:hypothetical protein
LVITGSNTYSGGTSLTVGPAAPQGLSGTGTLNFVGPPNGALQLAAPAAQFYVQPAGATPSTLTLSGVNTTAAALAVPGMQMPAKVFYIITEGAGLGDSVRSVNCTGNETVLDAVSMINGISQVSDAKKIWIARPGASGKSTTLEVNWEDISRRGINTTNYTLQPGDRLVFGEDALMKQANLISKKTAPIERLMGITSLTVSTISSLNSTPGGGAVVKDIAKRGLLADDEEVKQFVARLIQLQEEESKKLGSKPADKKTAP